MGVWVSVIAPLQSPDGYDRQIALISGTLNNPSPILLALACDPFSGSAVFLNASPPSSPHVLHRRDLV